MYMCMQSSNVTGSKEQCSWARIQLSGKELGKHNEAIDLAPARTKRKLSNILFSEYVYVGRLVKDLSYFSHVLL